MLVVLCCFLLFSQIYSVEGRAIKDDKRLLNKIKSLLTEIAGEEKQEQQQRQTNEGTCDIYHNAIIYTVNTQDWVNDIADVLIVEDKTIVYVNYWNGEEADVDDLADEHCETGRYRKFIDLGGYTVMPGIHDVHSHPLEAGSEVGGTCKFKPGFKPDTSEVIAYLKKCSEKQAGTDWILGHGHSIHDLFYHVEKGGRPPVEILDDAISDDPVVIMEETSHSVWVNSKALERYENHTNGEPVIGAFVMEGAYRGILLENAAMVIMEMAMSPYIYPELLEYNYQGLMRALEVLRRNGITSVCDARSFWRIKHHEAWERVRDEGNLTARAILDLWAYPNVPDSVLIKKLKDLYDNDPNSLLRKSQIKFYSDGIIPATTAAMLYKYPYPLGVNGLSDTGMNYFTESRLAKYVKELQSFDGDKRFDFHIHAIGDRGVREALDAIEEHKDSDSRHRLTHLEIVNQNDIPRFEKLGVVADFQVAGNFTLPSHRGELEDIVGFDRAYDSVPVKFVHDTGAIVTLSSDWDVSPVNPFLGMQHAITRGHQSIDLKSAVEMYTINAAYVMRQETKVGSLVSGKEADFIVIDQDIFEIDPKDIQFTKVLKTFLQGEEIHSDATWDTDVSRRRFNLHGRKQLKERIRNAYRTI